jgi:hypothetical protein
MSKRHHSSRRRSYGRRQHELRERHDRPERADPSPFQLDEWSVGAPSDPLGFLDLPSHRSPRLRFVLGD